MLFQKVYHGSGADFDKFDTETYGLSGEGSMALGYGTYVSGSRDISEDYADKQHPESDVPIRYKGKEANYTERNAYIRLNQSDVNQKKAYFVFRKDNWNRMPYLTDYIKHGSDLDPCVFNNNRRH